ncbi:MAG: RidA family protein [Candidatus Nitrosocosmicus sp.]
MIRKKISTKTKWESEFGYSRAVCVENHIYISGTTSTDENGNIVGKNDIYLQTIQIFKKIQSILQGLKSDLKDIVRIRIYIVDMDNWREVAKAHLELFNEIRPTCSIIEVNRLIDPDLLIEIEVDAFIHR